MKIKLAYIYTLLMLLCWPVLAEDLLDDVGDMDNVQKEEKSTVTQTAPLVTQTKAGWEYPPVIQASKWGKELRIVVEPNILMDQNLVSSIDSVKLESEHGAFLGLKNFGAQEVRRRAEFMLDPQAIGVSEAKITVNSTVLGPWSVIVPLSDTEFNEAANSDSAAPVPAAPTPPPAKAKKKGWFW